MADNDDLMVSLYIVHISLRKGFLVTGGAPSPEPVLLCPSDRLCKDPG